MISPHHKRLREILLEIPLEEAHRALLLSSLSTMTDEALKKAVESFDLALIAFEAAFPPSLESTNVSRAVTPVGSKAIGNGLSVNSKSTTTTRAARPVRSKSARSIKVAVIGVGNCASSLVQGVAYYRSNNSSQGLIHDRIGGYGAGDVEFVMGVDVDARKVGKDIAEAIFAAPNNTAVFQADVPATGAKVIMGRVLDGVASHMTTVGDKGFILADAPEATREGIVAALKESGAEVLLNFLPVGSQEATEFYMECALEAGVGVVNCMPVFIASRPEWEARFRAKCIPIVGDDIKAQIGATIVHRVLSSLFGARGVTVERTYQLNTGGNTDFMNMLDRQRLGSKKESKTEAVQAMLAQRLEDENIHVGPSDYVPWQKDNKLCFLRLEGTQWGNVPMNLELRLSVEDSPNSAACVMDAIRCCKVALERGEGGALIGPSAYFCKHPPQQFSDDTAAQMVEEYIVDAALVVGMGWARR